MRGEKVRGGDETQNLIRFVSYNIRNGRNGGLESVLRVMDKSNLDLGILQETKLTDGVYTCRSAGYSVVDTDAPRQHHGRVMMLYQ